jgi:ABC-type multidrug transport system fused ATPase/permease subunit
MLFPTTSLFNAVYNLSKDSWQLQPWQAGVHCLGSGFCTLCRYGITFLDASILTKCVSGMQNPQSVTGPEFIKVLTSRIVLSILSLVTEWVLAKVLESSERQIRQVRTRKVMAAFYNLEFALMTKEILERFRRLSGDIVHSPTYFKEPIDLICRMVEVGFTAVVVGRNIVRLTPLLATFCITLTTLNSIKVFYSILARDETKGRAYWGPKSLAERRARQLQNLAFQENETARDIVLHGAANWLIQSFERSSKKIPPKIRENDKHHMQTLFSQTLTLLEIVGVPALSILTGEKITFESYHLVQQCLSSICRNATVIQEFVTHSVKDSVSYAEEYFRCLEMGKSCERLRALQKPAIGAINSLEIRDVYFHYPKEDNDLEVHEAQTKLSPTGIGEPEAALKGVTFAFQRGKVYSIVGKNGGGKSTLVNLLTKLHSPQKGSVLVNGIDLETLSSDSWHKKLAVAPQAFSELYGFTIRENIGLGQTPLLDDDSRGIIEREARAGGITEFADLQTYVGSLLAGNKVPGSESETWKGDFSGGQWQAIALARTLCRTLCDSVEVLILDEPTSALDPIAEHRLFERLRKERAERITIFISHRLQTARASDCVLVMDDGILVQSGNHDELLSDTKGLYAHMYALQNETLD